MRKLFCLFAAVIACLLLMSVASAETTVPTTCEACGGIEVQWEPIPKAWNLLEEGHYHYYLTGNDKTYRYTPNPNGTASASNSKKPVTICLDLNGYYISTTGRALGVYDGCTLNIMDSSAAQTGYIEGKKGTNNTNGGTIFNYGTTNLYSGTLKFNPGAADHTTCSGGVLSQTSYDTAVFNMYGGRLEGGQLVASSSGTSRGATIYADAGSIHLYGGEVFSGKTADDKDGPCIYLNRNSGNSTVASLTLSGNAMVEHIFVNSSQSKLNIDGTYSGKARVTFDSSISLTGGKVIGAATNDPNLTGDLFCTNGGGWVANVDGGNVKLTAYTPNGEWHSCAHCKEIVRWTAMTSSNYTTPQTTSGTYHYYLSGKLGSYVQIGNSAGTTHAEVCLDLYGNTLQPSSGRAILVWGDASTLNLMDTVGGGKVHSKGGSNNERGAVISVSGGHTLNMYSGTVSFEANGSTVTKRGVLAIGGTLNMYGGKIEGADLTTGSDSTGGAVYLYNNAASLNVYGGEITSGKVNSVAPCVSVNTTGQTVKLAGDAKVENIYFSSNDKNLTVSGDYTGTASVTYATAPELGAEVGVAADDARILGTLSLANGDRLIKVEGTKLVTAINAPVVIIDGETETGYATLQEAVNAYESGCIKLLKPMEESVTVSRDITLDLNGYSITGTVTVANGATLYGKDQETDDYTVSDGIYGKLTATGNVTGAEGYFAVTEDGSISFHRYTVKITHMTLRSENAGIYYKCSFLGDEIIADMVESFGVALSVVEMPNETNLETHCKYSVFTDFEPGATGNATSSTLLKNILKTTNSDFKNKRNLNIQVYGRPYLKTADGYIFGESCNRTLAQQLEDVDKMFTSLSADQRYAVMNLYKTYSPVLSEVDMTNAANEKTRTENTLSLLMVGNSFCYYYVEELYGLLMANPDPNRGYTDVEIVNVYYTGCRLDMHYTWWVNNEAHYSVFKTDANGRVEQTPATGTVWTLEDALKLSDWDYMSLQGMSSEVNYTDGAVEENIAEMTPYAAPLLERFYELFPKAQLLWHRTWPFEVGRISGSITYTEELNAAYNAGMQAVCDYMCTVFDQDKPYDLKIVNSGAAWPIAREENAKLETSLIPEGGLCARLRVRNENTFPYFEGNANAGDGYHDGDIGGGQFLNACVWYETITGQSCLENPYKPTTANGNYELSDEFASLLRNAAHTALNPEE